MPVRSYLSIGEVLLALKTEFPDITISKIRFLEGEGLIEPERTASGYRKFYEHDVVGELERFGILCTHGADGNKYFDGDDYVVLSIVKDLFKYGLEPRHLTMYRHFSEREASLFEAIILPMLRQRNPDARRAATESLTELARLSRKLKQALLRTNLRQYMQSP